jgi:transcription initiation factor TFIIF subunit beta
VHTLAHHHRYIHHDDNMASVKTEGEAHPGASVKTDPDLANDAIAALPDEDIYEDAGDIDFTDASQNLYMMRVPNWLWKTWSELDDDAEIKLGTVRVEGELDHPKRVRINLRFYAGRD